MHAASQGYTAAAIFLPVALIMASCYQLVNCNDCNDPQQGGVKQFIVFGQPLRQVDVKIMPGGVGILSCNDRQRAKEFKTEQHDSLQYKQAVTDPEPFIYFIGDGGIQHIKDHHIEKYPYEGVDEFYEDKLAVACYHMVCKEMTEKLLFQLRPVETLIKVIRFCKQDRNR